METFQNLILTIIFAILCGTLAWIIKTNKQMILTYTEDLIQKAESTVQGSGLGAEKKAMVVAQLEAIGVSVNSWLSAQIDTIVSTLNSKGAWLANEAQTTATDLISTATTNSDITTNTVEGSTTNE